MEVIGWVGGLMLAICGAPQAWVSYKQKHSEGISWSFIMLWLLGEIFTLAYIWPSSQWPLIFNYSSNIAFLLIITWYKAFPEA